jgi:hypothetical protein
MGTKALTLLRHQSLASFALVGETQANGYHGSVSLAILVIFSRQIPNAMELTARVIIILHRRIVMPNRAAQQSVDGSAPVGPTTDTCVPTLSDALPYSSYDMSAAQVRIV